MADFKEKKYVENELTTILIKKTTKKRFKGYADKNGLVLYKLLNKVINDFLKRGKND